MADTSFFDKVFPNGVGSAIGLPDGTLESIIENGGDLGEYLTGYKSGNLTGESTTQGGQFFNNAIETLGGYIDTGLDALEVPRETVQEGIKFLKSDSDAVIAEKEIAQQIENQKLIELDPLGEFSGIEPNIIPDFESLNIDPDILSGLDVEVDADKETAASRESEIKRAEELKARRDSFAKNENEIADAMVSRDGKIEGELNAEDGFMAAMDDFLGSARGAGPEVPKDRTIAEYKKAFSEATGIDTSGKVDKKDALMAFGLALMQNKAGKGLNVGKMLESVGEAGDKALPALEKAKERARQGALAGGKYALQTKSSDKAVRAAAEEKMLNRDKYWVYKKGTSDKPFEGFETGQFEDLNKYELDKLMKDPKFQEQYEFVKSNDRMDVLSKREAAYIAANDLGDQWEKSETVSLIGGDWKEAPAVFQITSSNIKSNWKGDRSVLKLLGQNSQFTARQFQGYQEDIYKDEKKFDELINNINQGVSIPGQIGGSIREFLIGMGVSGVDTSTPAKAKQALKNFATDNATEILKESGKTLSDGDRKLVAQRVGEISWGNANPELIKRQIKDVYDLIVVKAQKNLDVAVDNLDANYGVSFTSGSNNSGQSAITKEEVVEFNKMYGTKFTMENFPKD